MYAADEVEAPQKLQSPQFEIDSEGNLITDDNKCLRYTRAGERIYNQLDNLSIQELVKSLHDALSSAIVNNFYAIPLKLGAAWVGGNNPGEAVEYVHPILLQSVLSEKLTAVKVNTKSEEYKAQIKKYQDLCDGKGGLGLPQDFQEFNGTLLDIANNNVMRYEHFLQGKTFSPMTTADSNVAELRNGLNVIFNQKKEIKELLSKDGGKGSGMTDLGIQSRIDALRCSIPLLPLIKARTKEALQDNYLLLGGIAVVGFYSFLYNKGRYCPGSELFNPLFSGATNLLKSGKEAFSLTTVGSFAQISYNSCTTTIQSSLDKMFPKLG